MPAKLTLAASRNVPWNPTIDLYYLGDALPLTGASVKMQVRQYAGAPGDPNLEIASIPFDDSEAATAASPTRRLLRLSPSKAEAALAAMPAGLNEPEAGECDRFFYDIILTYADAAQDMLAAGDFLLSPGVTV